MYRRWTQSEIEILRQHYNVDGALTCSKLLNRQESAIRKKAYKLGLKSPNNKTKTHEQYENELMELEVDCFPIEIYINAKTAIQHECINGHRWAAEPNSILDGHGCPQCCKRGLNLNKPAILYYISIEKDNEKYYKVGVTNKTVKDRFYSDRDKSIQVLWERKFDLGIDALKAEKAILSKFANDRQNVKGFLKSYGNTELFEYDILRIPTGRPYQL